MSKSSNLASFCRLCLIKTANKVPVFGGDQANVSNLLELIELSINPEVEGDAVVCFDCIVTLEGFFQFKEQCHINDEFIKKLPPKDSAELPDDSSEADMDGDYLEEADSAGQIGLDSEEEGLVEDVDAYEPLPTPKRKVPVSHKTPASVDDSTRKSVREQKPTERVSSSVKGVISVRRRPNPVQPTQIRKKIVTRKPPSSSVANDLPILKDSYPDYFHFERGQRSVNYTLVFYGERYNSAIYSSRYTYWQCAHRRRYQCPAAVNARNDYGDFERRFEHTHGELTEKGEFELFTPKRALPDVFRITSEKLMARRVKKRRKASEEE